MKNNFIVILSLLFILIVFTCFTMNAEHDLEVSIAQQPDSATGKFSSLPEDTLIVTVKRDNLDMIIYPNPFKKESTINFSLDKSDFVTVKIYDVEGREKKAILKSAELQEGDHVIELNREGLEGGFYLVQVMSRTGRFAKKVILIE